MLRIQKSILRSCFDSITANFQHFLPNLLDSDVLGKIALVVGVEAALGTLVLALRVLGNLVLL